MASVASAAIPRSQADLVAFVDWRGVECLNQSTSHSLDNALKQGYRDDDDLHLESDADEQLLIYIPFTQVIKLHSVIIKGPEEEGPKMVKLFANKEHMGFSNVNDYPPSDSIALSPKNLKERPVNLKYIKFQGVCSLTIFIEDNQGVKLKFKRLLLWCYCCGRTWSDQSTLHLHDLLQGGHNKHEGSGED
ncbi:PITH domain-containing protein At3g04780 isoform X1 [Elaeis guineensis]|uniref:PITH domain-containing protein At3g04780 isoform X1 n=1 Tax=Elaeis guineensis var. tenera TaxID=51953 RepID=UPI003C6CEC8C